MEKERVTANNHFGILVLAAGKSRRFGSDKLMAKMPDGRPVIAHSLEPLLILAKEKHLPLCVITRIDNEPLINYLKKENIPYSISNNAQLGMGSSIADGVKKNSDWQGWMIALADMPNITLNLLAHLSDRIKEKQSEIIRPVVVMDATNIPAHPVYFPKRCYAELISLAGDNGAKNIIKNPILLNKINDRILTEDIFIDVDTQERFDRVYKQKQRTA